MSINEKTLSTADKKKARSDYEAIKLSAAQKIIHVFVVVASVSNFLFLVCDLIFIRGQSERLASAGLRLIYSIALILMIRKLQRVRTYQSFSILVTVLEAIGAILFILILFLYDSPDFMIQSFGMLFAVLVIFIVPSRCEYMLGLSIGTSILFYAVCYFLFKDIDLNDFGAAITYTSLTIIISSLKTFGTDRNAKKEFEKRTLLEQTSTRDYLTNVATRERLEEEARRWMNFCRRQGLPLCLVFVDIDDLKRINDHYGHVMGDIALKEISSIMKKQLRSSDIIARWGGDEFVLLLPNVALQNAVLLLERVKDAVNQLMLEGSISVSCSFGVVQMGQDSTYAEMLSQADAMMYRAKQSGKGGICYSID